MVYLCIPSGEKTIAIFTFEIKQFPVGVIKYNLLLRLNPKPGT